MKQGKSLIQLAAEIERRADARKDFVQDTRELKVQAEFDDKVPAKFVFNGEDFTITPHTHSQVSAYTKIPKPYYDRMLSEAPDLWEVNANHWLERKADRRMIRTRDGIADAFVSKNYRRLDNDLIATATLPIISDRGMEVVSMEVTDTRLYIKAVDHSIKSFIGKPSQGDVMAAGLMITNSEIGAGSATVSAYDVILRCTNGWVGEKFMRKVHVGGDVGDVGELYRDETVKQMERVFAMQLADVTRGVLSQEYCDRRAAKLAESKDTAPVEKPIKGMEVLAKSFGFNEDEKESILTHLLKGGDLSLWGMANAVTRAAEDAPSYDRATELERVGTKVIELAPSEWREVVNAA